MKADGLLKEVIVYRNVDETNYYSIPFRVTLADKNPEGQFPTFEIVEIIRVYPHRTEINVYDLKRPIYYNLPDGTRRKIIYHKKKAKDNV